jgi:ssDNA-binding Zn-finger/Zn-ribbon topoisomerase 1
MPAGPALSCPKCQRKLDAVSWHDETSGICLNCHTDFQFLPFPALTARSVAAVPGAAVPAEDAVCFFHAENKAEVVCESCGRFLCAVCAIDFAGQKLCPSCIATKKARPLQEDKSRVLYGGFAIALAGGPMILWPMTAVTAPVALGYVIYGWRRPRSLVTPSRARLVIAGVLAVLQIVGWLLFLGLLLFGTHKTGRVKL